MSLSSTERKLIRLLAEAYAFISDLRETGLRIGNQLIVQRTTGIDESVEQRKIEFPRIFQRYYLAALKRADDDRRSKLATESDDTNGEREDVSGREEKAERTEPKATPRRRIIKGTGPVKRLKPE